MTQYKAFMDAAGKPEDGDDGWCVVAGFLSTVSRWNDFENAWVRLLARHSIPYLQMSSLHARKGIFADPKWNDESYMIDFLSEAGQIVRSCALKWAVDLVKYGDFARAVRDRPGLRMYTNAYGLCGTAVSLRLQMEKVFEWFPHPLAIEHFFEEGDEGIKNIEQVFARCGMTRPIVRPGKPRVREPHLRHYIQFQAADWLAFESRKLVIKFGDSQPVIRASLRALLADLPGEANWWKFEDLITFCDRKIYRGEMS